MANSKKITQKDRYNELLAIPAVKANADLVEFINGRIAQLEKKSGAKSDKPSATQKANAELKVKILAEMEDGKAYTISDMLKALPCCADLSNQKVSAVIKQMVEDNSVIRSEDKRKAYFTKA